MHPFSIRKQIINTKERGRDYGFQERIHSVKKLVLNYIGLSSKIPREREISIKAPSGSVVHKKCLSKKLVNYLDHIEKETNRRIEIEEIKPSHLFGMKSAFLHSPDHIHILVAKGSDLKDPEMEQSVAHEATHGLLVYRDGFQVGFYKGEASPRDRRMVALSMTMVTDINVNKLISKAGFLPYDPDYPASVRKEGEAMKDGRYIPQNLAEDLNDVDRIMVFRYVLAWGYLTYFELDPDVKKVLKDYSRTFRRNYPSQYKLAKKCMGIVLMGTSDGMFTAETHKKTVDGIIRLWELDDVVELRSV